eukprot:610395-Hanusia_phi.AAC.1
MIPPGRRGAVPGSTVVPYRVTIRCYAMINSGRASLRLRLSESDPPGGPGLAGGPVTVTPAPGSGPRL